jgi:mono/diheme cytochrome c family protein
MAGGIAWPAAALEPPPMLLAQKSAVKKKKGAARPGTAAVPAEPAAPATAEKAAAPASDSSPKFSREIAPILVGNCIGCHNPDRRRGKFDLTTFEKLMAGSDAEKVIEPGKPGESHLVLRLRGEETPKMPQGDNNNLSEEAIARIESWVKAGARLDAGIDPKALLTSYAPTAEQLRVAELKKLPADQRDKMVETVALQRWKQASPKTTPEVTPSAHFLLFSTLPKDRAAATLKGMETAYAQLRTILSRPSAPALDWAEKTSLFVFNDSTGLVEFIRTLENRESDASVTGTASFGVKEPYVAVIDPLAGREDPSSGPGTRKSPRGRRGDEESGERSVAGLLAEQMASGVLRQEKEAPRWLCLGLGAYFAAALDPRCTYVQRLQSTAAAQYQQGWTPRANEAVGDRPKDDELRAIGYALVDWMTHDAQARPRFPAFVRGMIDEGGPKLDDVLRTSFGVLRQDFFSYSGAWVASRYRSGR